MERIQKKKSNVVFSKSYKTYSSFLKLSQTQIFYHTKCGPEFCLKTGLVITHDSIGLLLTRSKPKTEDDMKTTNGRTNSVFKRKKHTWSVLFTDPLIDRSWLCRISTKIKHKTKPIKEISHLSLCVKMYGFEAMTFNIHGGYLEAIVRGHRAGLLTAADYNNLCQCETLDDIKMHLSATEYGPYLQNGAFSQQSVFIFIRFG